MFSNTLVKEYIFQGWWHKIKSGGANVNDVGGPTMVGSDTRKFWDFKQLEWLKMQPPDRKHHIKHHTTTYFI